MYRDMITIVHSNCGHMCLALIARTGAGGNESKQGRSSKRIARHDVETDVQGIANTIPLKGNTLYTHNTIVTTLTTQKGGRVGPESRRKEKDPNETTTRKGDFKRFKRFDALRQ